jgi:hypothetical protein
MLNQFGFVVVVVAVVVEIAQIDIVMVVVL